MNFRPELAEQVLAPDAAKRKTVTRRLVSDNPNSPWWRGGCSLKPGKDYAVTPGRSKHGIGRVIVTSTTLEPLGILDDAEARREGFDDAAAFMEGFAKINGAYDHHALVWRVELGEVVEGLGATV